MLWRTIYCLATWAALPFVLGYFVWRGRREPAYRHHRRERLGLGAVAARDVIWIHAASVGEVVLAVPLVRALQTRYPDTPLLITTMTPTGRERAQKAFADASVAVRYVPLDTFDATRRFMRRTQPRAGLFIETELWPNLIAAAAAYGVPLVLLNASLSQRSTARYARWPLRLAAHFMLARVAGIGAASDRHAQRFVSLGASRDAVRLVGNLKYDTVPRAAATTAGDRLRRDWQAQSRPVWVAASTHEGEEQILFAAFAQLRRQHPAALLVLAPRHPQRFDAVAELIADQSLAMSRRSRGESVGRRTDIVLADTLGEVPLFYAAADVVFVGGSLVPGIGGHNVLEPAALARPFCVGPYVEEWREIVDALTECGAARVCDDGDALARAIDGWLAVPAQAHAAGLAGARHVEKHAGALDRSLDLLDHVFKNK